MSNIPQIWPLGFYFINFSFLGLILANFYFVYLRVYFGHFSLVQSAKIKSAVEGVLK